MRRQSLVLVIILIAPLAAAAPPPGQPEVSNEICSTWNSSEGVCDDYDSDLDATTSNEWVEGHVRISMESASAIEMSLELAIHELPRDDLGLIDLDMQGDSDPSDGIPADYIRNYRDLIRDDSSVEDRLIEKVEQIIQQVVDENFPNATASPLLPTSEISFFDHDASSCTLNPDIDSIDEENGMENDPFHPPICLQSVLTLNVNPTNIGMDPDTGDIDRVMQGLMAMGGEVTTNFTTIATSGHYIEYVMIPPSYSSIIDVNEPAEIFWTEQGQMQFSGARVAIDNLAGPPWSSPTSIDLVTVLGSDDDQPDWQNLAGPSLSLDLYIDVRDRMSSRIDMELGIHHLSAETLAEWGLNLETSTIKLDSVTSDGIRMFDSEMDVDAQELLSTIPVDSLSDTFSEALGVEVAFQAPTFSPSDDSGGLMFQHIPGVTCGESLAYRYCLGTSSPMASTHPVTLQTSTSSSEMHISSIVNQLIKHAEGDVSTMDLSKMTDEDLAALMSVLGVEVDVDLSFIQDLLPENFPASDVRITVLLPEWLESTGSTPDSLVFTANIGDSSTQKIGLEGASPFDWEHPICLESTPCEGDSPDLLCSASQKTCVSFEVSIDIESVAIHELTASASVRFSSEVTLEIYRLGIDPGEDEIDLLPVPADILRRIIVIGDRLEGGLLAGSDLESSIDTGFGEPIDFEVSNNGIQELARTLTESSSEMIAELGEIGLENQDLGIGYYSFNANLERTPFTADFGTIQMRDDPETSDRVPLKLLSRIDNAEIEMSLRQDQVDISIQPASVALRASSVIASAYGMPFFSDTGMQIEGASITQRITPLMEHTVFGTVKSSARFQILMPDSVRIVSFESEMGLGELGTISGRQVINYSLPTCPEAESWAQCSKNSNTDTVTYSIEVTWIFLIGELAPYALVLVVFVSLSVSRFRRKRKERKAWKTKRLADTEAKELEVTMEREFGKLEEKLVLVEEQFFDEDESSDGNAP